MEEKLTKERLMFALFGIPHLTPEQIERFEANGFEQPLLADVFLHLADCRKCRQLVRPLSLADFRAGFPASYRDDYVLEKYRYYLEPDPPPYFDEKITWREKFWRLYKYRENNFFDIADLPTWWLRLKAKFKGKKYQRKDNDRLL